MKKMYVITCMLCAAALTAAQEKWSSVVQNLSAQTPSIEGVGTWMNVTTEGKNQRVENLSTQTIRKTKDGEWEFVTELPYAGILCRLGKDFQFVSEEQIITAPEKIQEYGIDRLYYYVNDGKVMIEMYLNGKLMKTSKTSFDKETVVGSGFAVQVFALAASGHTSEIKLSNILGGMETKGTLSFIKTSDPLSVSNKPYDFPKAMKEALGSGDYIVADYKLSGVYGAVYPHHFYYAFRLGSDVEYAAIWGGSPDKASFQWRTK